MDEEVGASHPLLAVLKDIPEDGETVAALVASNTFDGQDCTDDGQVGHGVSGRSCARSRSSP